ncbi:MAG: LPS export ABC transporter periplasmic protein LptC [Alistipes indistinctus]
MMTQQSENLRLVYSQNGNLSYRFETPLLERYELAREPYMEFRKGVKVETYNDTTHLVESTLTANYAIFLENQQLWEAKGNVVATNAQGQKLETEQLFWNQKSKRIYSNVDSKVTQKDGVILGEGFESDEQFQDFIFRRPKGKVAVDTAPKERADSTGSGQAAAGSSLPVIREGRRWPSRNPDQRCTAFDGRMPV